MGEARGAMRVTPEQIRGAILPTLGALSISSATFRKKVDGDEAYKKARKHEPVN